MVMLGITTPVEAVYKAEDAKTATKQAYLALFLLVSSKFPGQTIVSEAMGELTIVVPCATDGTRTNIHFYDFNNCLYPIASAVNRGNTMRLFHYEKEGVNKIHFSQTKLREAMITLTETLTKQLG